MNRKRRNPNKMSSRHAIRRTQRKHRNPYDLSKSKPEIERAEWVLDLDALEGPHELSGLGDGSVDAMSQYSDCNEWRTVNFILDGEAIAAVENPSDGYRSDLAELLVIKPSAVKHKFKPVNVIGVKRGGDYSVVDFVSASSGAVILSVGTDESDDYYPSFVGEYDLNAAKKG